nr:ribosomal protein L23 [Allium fasciculatum]UUF92595.1 ribosomal protein L23 [Allium fasciculatum]
MELIGKKMELWMESNMQYLQKKVLGNNQYTSNVESGSTRTEIKHWVELFFGVKVIAMNSHRLPGKGRRIGPIMGHTMHYRRMIITLQPGYSIPPLIEKRT